MRLNAITYGELLPPAVLYLILMDRLQALPLLLNINSHSDIYLTSTVFWSRFNLILTYGLPLFYASIIPLLYFSMAFV